MEHTPLARECPYCGGIDYERTRALVDALEGLFGARGDVLIYPLNDDEHSAPRRFEFALSSARAALKQARGEEVAS